MNFVERGVLHTQGIAIRLFFQGARLFARRISAFSAFPVLHTQGIAIADRQAVASQAVKLIRSIRPDIDELTVFLSSPGGDVLAAIELGDFGACVLVLAAGVRRTPAPENVGLQRMNFDQKEFASMSRDRAKQKYTALAKRVETYLARMRVPKKLFQEITQQSSDKVRLPRCRSTQNAGTG